MLAAVVAHEIASSACYNQNSLFGRHVPGNPPPPPPSRLTQRVVTWRRSPTLGAQTVPASLHDRLTEVDALTPH